MFGTTFKISATVLAHQPNSRNHCIIGKSISRFSLRVVSTSETGSKQNRYIVTYHLTLNFITLVTSLTSDKGDVSPNRKYVASN
jgi:hypothetical protein